MVRKTEFDFIQQLFTRISKISGLYKCSIKLIFGVLLWIWRRENLVKALYYQLILLILLL